MKLKNIAEVKSGLVLSRKKAKVEFEIKRKYKLITLNNVEDYGFFNNDPFEIFESNEVLDEQYFTKTGDILFRLSYPNTAVHVNTEQEGLLVPAYFAIISPYTNEFMSEYIAWYLNSNETKRELLKSQVGTVIPSTNKNTLGSLNIKHIPLEKQNLIVKIQRLHFKEKRLLNQLITEKERLYKGIENHVIQDK